jgi:hypothetical protein
VELKADALAFGRAVDAEAKRISTQLSEVEAYLQAQQDIIDNEKKRIAEEAARKEKERFDSRLRECQMYGAVMPQETIQMTSEEQWEQLMLSAKGVFDARERERIEAAEMLKKLQEEKEKQAAIVAAQEAENRKLQDALLQQQAAEIAEARQREHEAELKRAIETEEKRKAEAAATREIADKKLFDDIKAQFPTVELAWVEIARLRKLIG